METEMSAQIPVKRFKKTLLSVSRRDVFASQRDLSRQRDHVV